MSSPDDHRTFVEAAAHTLGIPLDPAWTGAVCMNVDVILRFAAALDEFQLPDDAEPAPVFRA